MRFGGNADAVIGYLHIAHAVLLAGGNAHPAARAVVANAVVQQVDAKVKQQLRIAHHGGGGQILFDGDIAVAGVQRQILRRITRQGGKIQRKHIAAGGFFFGIQIRKLQNIRHKADHTGGFLVDFAAKIGHILGLGNAVFQKLGIAADAGERRF